MCPDGVPEFGNQTRFLQSHLLSKDPMPSKIETEQVLDQSAAAPLPADYIVHSGKKSTAMWSRFGSVVVVAMMLGAVAVTANITRTIPQVHAVQEAMTAPISKPIILEVRDAVAKKKCTPKYTPQAQLYTAPPTVVGETPIAVVPVSTECIGHAPEKVTYVAHDDMIGNVTYSHTDPEQPFLYLDPSVPGISNLTCNTTYILIQSTNVSATLPFFHVGGHVLIPLSYPSCSQQAIVNGTMSVLPGYRVIQNATVISAQFGIIQVYTTTDNTLANVDISIYMGSYNSNSTLSRRWDFDRENSKDIRFDYPLHWGKNANWGSGFNGGVAGAKGDVEFDMNTHFLYHIHWGAHIHIGWTKFDYSFNVGGNMDFNVDPKMHLDGNFSTHISISKYTPAASFSLWGNFVTVGIYGSIDFALDLEVAGNFDIGLPINITQQPWLVSFANGKFVHEGGYIDYGVDIDYNLSATSSGKNASAIPSLSFMPGVGLGISIFGAPAQVADLGFNSKFTESLDIAVPIRDSCALSNTVTYEGEFIVKKGTGFPATPDSKLERSIAFQKALVPHKVLDARCLTADPSKLSGVYSLAHGTWDGTIPGLKKKN
ncbi:hypothetical protein BC830DRAFT_367872 [Chytriomyces sp. MP71]|nr:hypothetical protein BC830DRAFT_367872 [Chytriomyces sp. MP71]